MTQITILLPVDNMKVERKAGIKEGKGGGVTFLVFIGSGHEITTAEPLTN